MADFRQGTLRCCIASFEGKTVACCFDVSLADTVKQCLRCLVQASGFSYVDTETGKQLRFHITSLDRLVPETTAEASSGDDFWVQKTVEQLAAEQGVTGDQLSAVWGALAGVWNSEEEFDEFLKACEAAREETEN